MRRSALAVIVTTAVLAVAACAPDSAERAPLAPTEPFLAMGDLCAGSLASDIAKQQKALFTGDALDDMQDQFAVIKSTCPDVTTAQLLTYIESMIGYSGAPTNAARAQGLVNLLGSVTLYVTSTALVRPPVVFQNTGGAAVLEPGEFMTTNDGLARLELDDNSTPGGKHLFTFEPRPPVECDGTTSLRITGNCYQVHDYPDEPGTYSPPATLTLCMRHNAGPTGIGHQKTGGAEVLPEVDFTYSCANTHAAIDSWLGREAGPLGRALAKTFDYLAPRPLFADDAGESGSIGSFSLVGGILNVVFEDNFGEINNPPDIGDAWQVDTTFPGYIRVQNGFGALTDSVVVLSQAQGNCANCPAFQLMGTRVNSSQVEALGSYQVTWTSLQNKPSVKEAPFVVVNEAGVEIARLSYVSVSSQNRLIFTVQQPGTDSVYDVGSWVKDVPQNFKITVHQTVLGGNDNTVSFGFGTDPNDPPVVPGVYTPFATKLMKVGYVLTGIDAGIIASNKWVVIRLSDSP